MPLFGFSFGNVSITNSCNLILSSAGNKIHSMIPHVWNAVLMSCDSAPCLDYGRLLAPIIYHYNDK